MADEIRSELTFEAQQAITTLQRMEAELNQYNRAVTGAAGGTKAFNASGSAFDKQAAATVSSLTKLSDAAASATGQLQKVGQAGSTAGGGSAAAIEKFNKLFETSRDRIKAASDEVVRSFRNQEKGAKTLETQFRKVGNEGAKSGKSVLISWQSVARIFAIQNIHKAVTLISNAFVSGIRDAEAYQKSLSEVQTIGGDLNLSLGELDDKVRAISDAFGQPLSQVSEGLYQTLSNQVGEASQAFDFLTSANKFAAAAVTGTDSAVNLLSSAVNSFNLDVTDADDIGAKFFKTIELGRVRAEELANSFGRVGVLSAQLGVSFDETLASIATLTIQGLRFNEAFTLITNTQLKLIRPTDALKDAFKELGVTSAEAGIQAFGFQGFLKELAGTTGGTATELGALFGRVRAIRGVLGLTGDQAEDFSKTLNDIKQAAEENELSGAFAKVFDTDAAAFRRELNALRNFFVADFGQTAIGVLVNLGNAFGGLADAIKSIAFGLGAATIAFGVYAAAAVGAAFSMGTLGASIQFATLALVGFLGTPIGLIIAAGVAVAGLAFIYDGLTVSVREANEARLRGNDAALRTEVRTEANRRNALKDNEDRILSDIQVFLQKRQQAFQKDAKEALSIQENLLENIKQQVEDRVGVVESFVNRLESTVKDATSALKELNGELKQVGDDLDQFNFERGIKGLNDQQKASAQIERSQEAIRDLNRAIANGDTERANQLASIARSAANAALSTADQAGNANLVREAEDQVRSAIEAKTKIIKDQLADKRAEVNVARSLVGQESARLVKIKAVADEINKLEAISKGLVVSPDFNPEEAKKKAAELTKFFEREVAAAAGSAGLLSGFNVDFASIRNDLRQKFREPLTGVEINLTDAVQINLSRVVEALNKQASQLSAAETSALASLGVDTTQFFRGFQDAQTLVTELPKEIVRGVNATKDFAINTKELNDAFIDVSTSIDEVVSKLEAIESRAFADIFGGDTGGITGATLDGLTTASTKVFEFLTGLERTTPAADRLGQELKGLVFDFKAAFAGGDAQALSDAIRGVNTVSNALAAEGLTNASKKVDELSKALEKAVDEGSQAKIGENAAASLRPLETRIKEVDGAFKNTVDAAKSAGDAGVEGASRATGAQGREKSAIDATNRALARQVALQREAGSGGGGNAQGRAFGGMLFRAGGGMAFDRRQFGGQRGTDSIPTLLTAGESVNTLAATRQFFPQIQAMNAGVIPQFRQDGGAVNNNIGDININVNEAATGRDTAREVMAQIKREFRRNTFNIGRI